MKYDLRALPSIAITKALGNISSWKLATRFHQPLATPWLIDFVLTERCNSRCRYCLCWKVDYKDEPTTDEIIKALESLARLGADKVTFAGGEPLLRDDLETFVMKAKELGMYTNVTTNGISATPQRVRSLAKAGLQSLTWSLDTLDPKVYQFVRGVPLAPILANLEAAFDVCKEIPSLEMNISMVITKVSVDSALDVIRYAHNHNMFINPQIVHPAWYSEWFDKEGKLSKSVMFAPEDEEKLSELVETILKMKAEGYRIYTNSSYLRGIPAFGTRHEVPEGFHCRSGYSTISINSHLDFYSCQEAGIMGNLRKDKLEDVWFSRKWQESREKMYQVKCSKCWIICHTEGLAQTD